MLEGIKVIQDFLSPNFITALKCVINSKRNEYKWKTNLGWEQALQKNSAQVSIFSLNDTAFESDIIKIYEKYIDIKDCTFGMTYCLWQNGSYIPFHNDPQVLYGSTIYLNDSWEKDFGGLYIYEDKDILRAICPKYNQCIINNSNILHGTSIISNLAPLRETIQSFIRKKK